MAEPVDVQAHWTRPGVLARIDAALTELGHDPTESGSLLRLSICILAALPPLAIRLSGSQLRTRVAFSMLDAVLAGRHGISRIRMAAGLMAST